MTDSQEEKTEILRGFVWRLNSAADAAGLSQVDIAEKLRVSRSRVGNWFQANNLPRKAERVSLAKLLGVTVDWLVHGKTENDRFRVEEVEQSRKDFGGDPVRQVPVISWTHAGQSVAFEEMPRHFNGRVATSSTDPRAFALTVEGDSMEPKVFAGDRVICEPSRSPVNGRPVVARHENDEVQLRIYHKLPTGKIRLASMKPDIYPTLDHEPSAFHWIYPVKELIRAL
jgi:phage repressor protein C with HTH and peptisase S24 domain